MSYTFHVLALVGFHSYSVQRTYTLEVCYKSCDNVCAIFNFLILSVTLPITEFGTIKLEI